MSKTVQCISPITIQVKLLQFWCPTGNRQCLLWFLFFLFILRKKRSHNIKFGMASPTALQSKHLRHPNPAHLMLSKPALHPWQPSATLILISNCRRMRTWWRDSCRGPSQLCLITGQVMNLWLTVCTKTAREEGNQILLPLLPLLSPLWSLYQVLAEGEETRGGRPMEC